MKKICGLSSEMFEHKRKKNRKALGEASNTGKTFTFFLPKDEKTSTYLQIERNDNKGGRDSGQGVLEYLG